MSIPDALTLDVLAQFFCVNLDFLLSRDNSKMTVSANESALCDKLKTLDEEELTKVSEYIAFLENQRDKK